MLKISTWNAADLFEAEDSIGSVEEGKIADFVILDEKPLLEKHAKDIPNCKIR